MQAFRLRKVKVRISFTVLALLLVACSAPTQPAAKAPAAQAPAQPAKAAVPTKEKIVVATGVDLLTVNPFFQVIIIPDKSAIRHMYDSLILYDDNGKMHPSLAVSWENSNDTTWRFKLRDGVKFHNGEDFTAEDVKFTIETTINPDTKATEYSSYRFIDHVNVVDKQTVEIVTKGPAPQLPHVLTVMPMTSASYVKNNGGVTILDTKPNGTGPYKFVEWVKDTRLTMQADPNHWRGAPRVQQLVYVPKKEAATRISALLTGEADIAVNVPPEMVADIDRSQNASVTSVQSVRTMLIGLKSKDPNSPVANKLVRQAMSYAIDREALNKAILDGKGKPVGVGWHDYSFGYDPSFKPYPYDPEKAKQLLAQAGYANGFSIQMATPDGRYLKDKEMAQAVAGQLSQVGIKVEVEVQEFGNFVNAIGNRTSLPMALFAWKIDADPYVMLTLLHHKDGFWSMLDLPEMDKLIDEQGTLLDVEKRRQKMQQIQQFMYDEVPMLYLMRLVDNYGIAKSVEPFFTPMGNEEMWLYPLITGTN